MAISMATTYIAGAIVALFVVGLMYLPYIRVVRAAGGTLLDTHPKAWFYLHLILSLTAIGFALLAVAKGQMPQLVSLSLAAFATNPSATLHARWPGLHRVVGIGSGIFGFYTVVTTGRILANCLRVSEPGSGLNYLDFDDLMTFALQLERFNEFIGGLFRGYLLGDLDIFSSEPEPIFHPWTFAPMMECEKFDLRSAVPFR